MSTSLYTAGIRQTESQAEALRYLETELVPKLDSSNRQDLAAELKATVLDSGRVHDLRRLDPESNKALREYLMLEFEKISHGLKRGWIDAEIFDQKTSPLLTILEYLPEPRARSSTSETSLFTRILRRNPVREY